MDALEPLSEIWVQTAFNQLYPLLAVVDVTKGIAVPYSVFSAFLVFCKVIVRLQRSKRQLVSEQLESQHTEREYVGRRQHGSTSTGSHGLLRGHVGVGSEYLIGPAKDITLRHTVGTVAGYSEIRQSGLAILFEEHILRFQVPMHLSPVVQGIESDENVLTDTRRVAVWLAKQGLKVTAWTELHHNERIATNSAIVQ